MYKKESDIEVISKTKEWINKVVIGCNFCPFAAREIKRDSISYRIIYTSDVNLILQTLGEELLRMDKEQTIETTFIILPENFDDFNDYLDLIELCQLLLEEEGKEGVYQIASFHQHYQFDGTTVNDAANYTILSIVLFIYTAIVQESKLYDFPIRGLCIATPVSGNLDSFIVFIREELKPRNINTLILRIDYRYQFKSHPELIDTLALSEAEVKKIVLEAKKDGIQLIPQINLLGHQSWANKPGKLLSVYKEFDETPWLQMPALYSWPNSDSLYCKSYCPLHPELHKIIFDIID